MLKSYDTYCKECDYVMEQFIDNEENFENCPECGGEMKRYYGSKFNFKLIDDPKSQMCGWSHNNYAHNRYWDDYRAAKKEGRDVRPYGEDPA